MPYTCTGGTTSISLLTNEAVLTPPLAPCPAFHHVQYCKYTSTRSLITEKHHMHICETSHAPSVKHHMHLCETSHAPLWNIICTSVKQHMHLCETSHAPLWNITCTSVKHHMHVCETSHAPGWGPGNRATAHLKFPILIKCNLQRREWVRGREQ